MPRHSWSEPFDLEYRCHFIGRPGVIEGLQLFSAPDDELREETRVSNCANAATRSQLSYGKAIDWLLAIPPTELSRQRPRFTSPCVAV